MLNTKDPGTRRLLQTIEGKYRKSLPGSLKQSDDEEEDESEVPRSLHASQGPIRDIPIYKPPNSQTIKKPDWRDGGQSSSDDELPDPLKIIEK